MAPVQPFLVIFFANCIKIFHKNEVPTIILTCLTCLNLNRIKSYNIKPKFFCFRFFASYCKLTNLTKTDESMKVIFQQFYEYLLTGLLHRHLVHLILKVLAWEILNMKSEFAKKYNKGTMTEDVQYPFKCNRH